MTECAVCETPITEESPSADFCSQECHNAWWFERNPPLPGEYDRRVPLVHPDASAAERIYIGISIITAALGLLVAPVCAAVLA